MPRSSTPWRAPSSSDWDCRFTPRLYSLRIFPLFVFPPICPNPPDSPVTQTPSCTICLMSYGLVYFWKTLLPISPPLMSEAVVHVPQVRFRVSPPSRSVFVSATQVGAVTPPPSLIGKFSPDVFFCPLYSFFFKLKPLPDFRDFFTFLPG